MEKLISSVFWAFLLLFVAYISLSIAPSELLPTEDRERLISENLAAISTEMWGFAKPLLQLAFIVLIIEFAYSKFSGKQLPRSVGSITDVKSLIAIIVIVTFAISALSGSETSHLLKDVALVVIGFYFGGNSASVKTETEKETHIDNPINSPTTTTNSLPVQPKNSGGSSEEMKINRKGFQRYEEAPGINASVSATSNDIEPPDETIEARQAAAKNKLEELKNKRDQDS